uniref:Cytochrome-b5 reductase n=1 Tax=Parascaris univalens TaxID=6257 RepID=A0A915B5M5_PARUN
MRIMGANNCHNAIAGTTQVTNTSNNKRTNAPDWDVRNRNTPSMNALLSVPQTSKMPASIRSQGGRLKVALQPGRGIMDWVQLTAGKQLASQQLPFVTDEELRKHNSADDCWILLDNKVYDVTEYLTFHPGGIEQLMKAAGCDGTNLFHKYHSWINYETMLTSCFVGYFRGDRNQLAQPTESCFDDDSDEWLAMEVERQREETAAKLAQLNIRIIDTSKGRLYLSCNEWSDLKPENVCVDVVRNSVRILIKPFGGTPLELHWKRIPKVLTSGMFTVLVDSSVIKVQFETTVNMGVFSSLDLLSVDEEPPERSRECTITEIRQVARNIYLYEMSLHPSSYFSVPIGHHVYLTINKDGGNLLRSYTPVLVDGNSRKISFFIKIYEDGIFSSELHKLETGAVLKISNPIGTIDFLSVCAPFVVAIAAGTGITPMLRLLAARNDNSNTYTALLAINATPEDRLEKTFYQYCGLKLGKDRVTFYHFENDDHELNFRMMSTFLTEMRPKILEKREEDGIANCYRILICGPTSFVESAKRLVTIISPELESSVHIF